MSVFVQQQGTFCDFSGGDSWVILSPIEQSIKRKIEAVGTPLKDWDINIYRGVLTGYNDAFIITTSKRDEILSNCQNDDETHRTAELIRPILRGRDIKRYGYEWANLYLIATFPARHYNIDSFPAVKEYLLSFAYDSLLENGNDWVAKNYLAEFCKQKLEQTGQEIIINGKYVLDPQGHKEKSRKRTNNKWFETQDSISYWDIYLRTLSKISPTAEEKLEHKDDESFIYYKLARYKPSSYLTEDADLLDELKRELEKKTGISLTLLLGRQANVSDFMRKMLVRRFESSVAAFKQSLNSMILSSEGILRWIEKRDKIPVYKKGSLPDVEEFYETTDDDLSREIEEAFDKYTDRGFFEIDMKYIKRDEYLADMYADLALLRAIREEWFGKDQKIRFDHKLTEFKAQLRFLRQSDPKRKIVVFTEFADTANYLGDALKDDNLGIFKYTSGDSSVTSKKTIRENFDAGLKKDFQKDDYQILIATDAISEGYNLHRAGTIFNYDIPYNPTRVIQRIGRINRINKKMFDKLYIYNYFPTDIGEQETRTKQISTLKMAMIHAIMGEDTKALTSDEQLNAFFKERYRKELASSEELSWDTKYRRILDSVKNTDIYQEALDIPHRARIGRNAEKPIQGVLLCGKKGNDFVFKLGQHDDINPISISAEDAFGLFDADESEKPFAVSNQFEPVYQAVKARLFKDTVDTEAERSRREAFSIIKAWMKNKILSRDYLEDLLLLMRNDGLTGEEVRFINKLSIKDADKLPKKITPDYIKRCIIKMNAVDEGEETLILAEEIK